MPGTARDEATNFRVFRLLDIVGEIVDVETHGWVLHDLDSVRGRSDRREVVEVKFPHSDFKNVVPVDHGYGFSLPTQVILHECGSENG